MILLDLNNKDTLVDVELTFPPLACGLRVDARADVSVAFGNQGWLHQEQG